MKKMADEKHVVFDKTQIELTVDLQMTRDKNDMEKNVSLDIQRKQKNKILLHYLNGLEINTIRSKIKVSKVALFDQG